LRLDAEVAELARVGWSRRSGQRIGSTGSLREGDYVAD
jgi:hypothetical protein